MTLLDKIGAVLMLILGSFALMTVACLALLSVAMFWVSIFRRSARRFRQWREKE